MKTGALLLLNLAASVGVVAAARALFPPPAPAPVEAPRPERVSDLPDRVGRLEARVDELTAALARLRKESEEERQRATAAQSSVQAQVEKERERANAAEMLMAAATGDSGKRPEMDAFAKEVSKAMKQGIRQEFRKISDLVTNPSPEALDQRRRQLKMFANMMGNNAGLDQAQIATFERILNDTDEHSRDELRPLLTGVEDYRQVDYAKVKKVTEDSFTAQNEQMDKEFPKEKSERLKQQIEPIRNLFGAMIDELGKEAAATEPK